jgi:transcriptional regulator of acetoin/glycerol metabolism
MAALSRAAGNERHAAMLGDEQAVVLDIVGDELASPSSERPAKTPV